MQLQSVELPPLKNSILAILWPTLIFRWQVRSLIFNSFICRIGFYCMGNLLQLGKLLLGKSVTGEVSVGEVVTGEIVLGKLLLGK